MINNFLKNFCLITFALIAPITLPAGGIQKSFNQNNFPNNLNEITLSSDTSLYSYPGIHTKELQVLDIGTSLSVLRKWKVSESEVWENLILNLNPLSLPSDNIFCKNVSKGIHEGLHKIQQLPIWVHFQAISLH